MSNRYQLLTLCVVFALPFYLNAVEVSSQKILSPEVIVEGDLSTTDSGLIDAPVKVEVLSKEHLEKMQYQNLAQSLSDIPGVGVISVSRRAGAHTALIQGFGENSVLVMIDGTPVSQNSSFGFDLSQVSTSDIEKVEVIKGGASALYGSQAIGGVINVVTKKPKSQPQFDMELATGVLGAAEAGGETRTAKVNYSGKSFASLGTKFSLAYNEQNPIELDSSSITKDSAKKKLFNGSFYLLKEYKQHTFFLNYMVMDGANKSYSSKPYSSSAFGATNNTTETLTQNFKIGDVYKFDNGEIRALINYEVVDDELNLNDNPETPFVETLKQTKFESRRVDFSLKDYKVSEHTLTTGFLFKEDFVNQNTRVQVVEQIIVDSNDIESKRITSTEAFIQDNVLIGDWEISPGARYQYNQNYGGHLSPKVNISLYKDIGKVGTKTWATVGTGYRTPSVKERFFTLDHSNVANYIVLGNEDLSPETSTSIQLGEELRFSGGHSLYANFFYNQVEDLIETVEVDTGTSQRLFTYKNIENVTSHGIEFGSKFVLNPKLLWNLNYTYTKAQDESTKLILSKRPMYTGNSSLTYMPRPKWQIVNTQRYHGTKYLNDSNTIIGEEYWESDLKVNYQFDKKINVFASLNNIFNVKKDPTQDTVIPVIDDRPSMGRNVFFGFKLRSGVGL